MRVFRAERLVLDDELIGLLSSQEDYFSCAGIPQLQAVPRRGLRLCGLFPTQFVRPTGDVLMQLMIILLGDTILQQTRWCIDSSYLPVSSSVMFPYIA